MNIQEITERLRALDWTITDAAVNRAGRMVYRIDHRAGLSVVMFHEDTADLVTGHAELEDILERNRHADLADPWSMFPTVH